MSAGRHGTEPRGAHRGNVPPSGTSSPPPTVPGQAVAGPRGGGVTGSFDCHQKKTTARGGPGVPPSGKNSSGAVRRGGYGVCNVLMADFVPKETPKNAFPKSPSPQKTPACMQTSFEEARGRPVKPEPPVGPRLPRARRLRGRRLPPAPFLLARWRPASRAAASRGARLTGPPASPGRSARGGRRRTRPAGRSR